MKLWNIYVYLYIPKGKKLTHTHTYYLMFRVKNMCVDTTRRPHGWKIFSTPVTHTYKYNVCQHGNIKLNTDSEWLCDRVQIGCKAIVNIEHSKTAQQQLFDFGSNKAYFEPVKMSMYSTEKLKCRQTRKKKYAYVVCVCVFRERWEQERIRKREFMYILISWCALPMRYVCFDTSNGMSVSAHSTNKIHIRNSKCVLKSIYRYMAVSYGIYWKN